MRLPLAGQRSPWAIRGLGRRGGDGERDPHDLDMVSLIPIFIC
jgi:hypothetical protein